MSYKILPTEKFVKDFKKLDRNLQRKIKNKIEEVSIDPIRYKHLRHDLSGRCRIRIEKLRILFSYNTLKEELYPEKIIFGHRYGL
tara:strand:- start:45 stop:299 length:255 start_codon:yes stop_codon:yes gene_type:complete